MEKGGISRKTIAKFREAPANEQCYALLGLGRRVQEAILSTLNDNEILELLHYLDPDETADVVQRIASVYRQKRIVNKLSERIREKVEYLLKFNPTSAAGMMDLNYIEIDVKATFKEVTKALRRHDKNTGRFPAILVVRSGVLLGQLPGHILVVHRPSEKIAKFYRPVQSVKYTAKQGEVVKKFKQHPHDKIIVLDQDKTIMGVIYSDDMLQLLQKQSGKSLLAFAGVSHEEDVLDSAMTKVKFRYKWLMLNLLTAFLAASIVSFYKDTIAAFVLLVVYMPVIAGMGGNAGTQTLAVVVRGLALKEIDLSNAKPVVINEMIAGATNGLINGVIVAIVATMFHQAPLLGLVVGVAMIVNLVIAGFFGAIVPVILKQFGKDPASSATIFITTATDVCGFFVFLHLAQLVL